MQLALFPIVLYTACFLNFVTGSPYPANDPGAKPEDAPLPGRTDTQRGPNGVTIAHYGDDFMPGHMRHVQDSIAEFPRNGDPYPYRPDAEQNRNDRLKGIPSAPPQPASGEPQVLDEKTWASQHNPNQNTDTTVRPLPQYESGGALPHHEAEQKKKYEAPAREQFGQDAKLPEKYKWHRDPEKEMKDGSLRTEGALAGKTKLEMEAHTEKTGETAKSQLKANPGWLPISPDQHRAHEAPAVMEAPNKPKPDDKGKGPAPPPNSLDRDSPPTTNRPPREPPAVNMPTRQSERIKAKRPDAETAPALPFVPKSNQGRSKNPADPDPNNYLRPEPTIPQYHPAKDHLNGGVSPDVGIHPPSDSQSSSRIPPRPQNRETFNRDGLQRPNPAPVPLPAPTARPGGPNGKEGTSKEAPERPKPDWDTQRSPSSAPQSAPQPGTIQPTAPGSRPAAPASGTPPPPASDPSGRAPPPSSRQPSTSGSRPAPPPGAPASGTPPPPPGPGSSTAAPPTSPGNTAPPPGPPGARPGGSSAPSTTTTTTTQPTTGRTTRSSGRRLRRRGVEEYWEKVAMGLLRRRAALEFGGWSGDLYERGF